MRNKGPSIIFIIITTVRLGRGGGGLTPSVRFFKWKNDDRASSASTCHHFSYRMYALRGWGGGEKSTLCTLVIMMKIMDGP